jgi:competence protein ComEA
MLLLLALAVAGQGVRYLLARPGDPPGQIQLLGTASSGSPTTQRDSAMARSRPLNPGERIDPDQASAAELARLPKVGFHLARVIVADREAHGAFGSVKELDRVPGVGPGLLQAIGPHLVFSRAAKIPSSQSFAPPASSPPPGVPASQLDLNSATLTELDALPGVGPAKAAAILQYREQHGRFTSVEQLEQVPGFGPAALSRLRSHLTAY